MNHVKVGGVCLLLLIIAAALPINVLAQTPSDNGNADDGATPVISQSLLSKSTQGETISTEKLAKRNAGLKPLGSAKTEDTSKSSQPSGQTETANQPDAQASAAEQTNSAQETSASAEEAATPAADTTTTSEIITSDATVTPEIITSDATVTPETITRSEEHTSELQSH